MAAITGRILSLEQVMSVRRWSIGLCLLGSISLSEGLYASPLAAVHLPIHAAFGHEKLVQFSVRNDTASVLKMQCGDKMQSVDPGKTAELKLPVGTKVTFAEANGSHAAGELLAQAGTELSGTTIVVH